MTFDEWAILGKDEGMERGHYDSVKHMFKLVLDKQKRFSFALSSNLDRQVNTLFSN